MSIYHDEIEIEDMEYDEEDETYYYPCPCGDRFQITKVNHRVLPHSALGPPSSNNMADKTVRPARRPLYFYHAVVEQTWFPC